MALKQKIVGKQSIAFKLCCQYKLYDSKHKSRRTKTSCNKAIHGGPTEAINNKKKSWLTYKINRLGTCSNPQLKKRKMVRE